MFLISLSTWTNWPPGWVGGVILRLFSLQHFFPRALLHGLKLWGGWVGGVGWWPMWFWCHPSPNWTWILIFDWFGIGFGSKGTRLGTRAWQYFKGNAAHVSNTIMEKLQTKNIDMLLQRRSLEFILDDTLRGLTESIRKIECSFKLLRDFQSQCQNEEKHFSNKQKVSLHSKRRKKTLN